MLLVFLLLRCSEKMVVNNGDESRGTIRQQSPTKKQTQEYGKLLIKDIFNRTH